MLQELKKIYSSIKKIKEQEGVRINLLKNSIESYEKSNKKLQTQIENIKKDLDKLETQIKELSNGKTV